LNPTTPPTENKLTRGPLTRETKERGEGGMGSARHVEPERNVGATAADPRPARALHSQKTCARSTVHR
jgi:hypothetical protein